MVSKMKLTIELSPEEIKEAIIQYVRSNSAMSGVSITTGNVKFNVRERYSSPDPRESSWQASLTGAKVEAEVQPLQPRSTYYMDR